MKKRNLRQEGQHILSKVLSITKGVFLYPATPVPRSPTREKCKIHEVLMAEPRLRCGALSWSSIHLLTTYCTRCPLGTQRTLSPSFSHKMKLKHSKCLKYSFGEKHLKELKQRVIGFLFASQPVLNGRILAQEEPNHVELSM